MRALALGAALLALLAACSAPCETYEEVAGVSPSPGSCVMVWVTDGHGALSVGEECPSAVCLVAADGDQPIHVFAWTGYRVQASWHEEPLAEADGACPLVCP